MILIQTHYIEKFSGFHNIPLKCLFQLHSHRLQLVQKVLDAAGLLQKSRAVLRQVFVDDIPEGKVPFPPMWLVTTNTS